MTPEECAELIVSGTEREYVKGLLDYVLSKYDALDMSDPQIFYKVQRIYDLMPGDMVQIYLENRDAILAEAYALVEETALDAETEEALQRYTGHTPGLMYSYQYDRLHQATVQGCVEIINRDNVDLMNNMAQRWYETSIKAISEMSVYQKGPGAIIEEGVRSMNGITDITYTSGAKYPIDAAIRRHIETQLNQNHQRLTEMRAAEYGWDLFMCSAHADCRPTHYDFQGQIFSKGEHIGEVIDGRMVLDYEEMGIGNVAGIYGANCRHYITPYVPGFSEPQEPPYDERTNEERYNLTQKQRARERTLRKDKLELYAAERSGDPDAIAQARLQVRKEQKSIREFCREHDLVRRYDLERAYPVDGGKRETTIAKQAKAETKALTTAARTQAQHDAVEAYVSGERMYINQDIRHGATLPDDDLQLRKDMDAATSKPLGKNTVLYRSVDASSVFGNMSQLQYVQMAEYLGYGESAIPKANLQATQDRIDRAMGKTITEKGFMSTTTDRELALEWYGFTGSNRPITLEIHGAKNTGAYVLKDENPELEERMGQSEVLLQRNVRYRVESIGIEGIVPYLVVEIVQ